jgi:hypothetical protein
MGASCVHVEVPVFSSPPCCFQFLYHFAPVDRYVCIFQYQDFLKAVDDPDGCL